MRRPALFLLFICFFTFFLGLGRQAITDADEAYYAESAREMVERGDWLTPFYNYDHRWQKPVLYYWLTAVTYLLFGVGEWSARLWSAFAGFGIAFATWDAGRRLTGYDDVGWFAGVIVATSFGCFAVARMALPDLPLAFFVTVTIAAVLGNRWALAGIAAGLGFLTKGPLAVLVPGLVIAPVWLRERKRWAIRARDVAVALGLFVIVGLPWYLGMTLEHGSDYLRSFFIGDNFERFATDRFNEPRSPLFYVPVLLGGLLPWTPYVVAAAWRRGRAFFTRRATLGDGEWRLFLWAAIPFLFFSISIGKQPRYILPILPPLAILTARSLLRRLERVAAGDNGARREIRIATYVTAGVLLVMAVLLARARELFITAIPMLTWMAVGALIGCVVILIVVVRRQRFADLVVVLPACAVVTLMSVQFGALAGERPEAVEQMAALVREHRTADEPLAVHHVFVRNLIFYTGLKQEDLFDDQHAAAFMRRPERVLMVITAQELTRLEGAVGVKMTPLAEVRYFNTANVKIRSLLLPDPDRDIQRVLLVTNR